MKFDINRLSQLAGIGAGESRTLTEASNRSYHDGVANDTSDERFGKNQLNELEDDREPLMQYEREDFETHKGEKTSGGKDAFRGMHKGQEAENEGAHLDEEDDEMLEIDEGMLRREILRMKKERLQETRLRGAIRNEIKDIFASLTNDNTWVYGDNKPRNSRKGTVNMGFPGIGFKK